MSAYRTSFKYWQNKNAQSYACARAFVARGRWEAAAEMQVVAAYEWQALSAEREGVSRPKRQHEKSAKQREKDRLKQEARARQLAARRIAEQKRAELREQQFAALLAADQKRAEARAQQLAVLREKQQIKLALRVERARQQALAGVSLADTVAQVLRRFDRELAESDLVGKSFQSNWFLREMLAPLREAIARRKSSIPAPKVKALPEALESGQTRPR